ncbi:S8 family serine peptidase [Novosphingobium cyanobacteriorum]|uniref:S8 family serine peptidase n=1 Tax=Novosphingobium cyanobacteriorum TaxID=3024215 RepID=A0ABT6CDY4_9SPHN|nr:S8 family serine peptidase [Novosphingobium cyanobacteriorum]MDF8331759.1 S8 family serine peptidase [Novosphingobium cyanobacteriorum]
MLAMTLHGGAITCARAAEPPEVEEREVEVERPERPETERPETERPEREREERAERSENEKGMDDATDRLMAGADLIDILARDEWPDRDDAGFPVRRGEVSAMDLSSDAIARLGAQGFKVISDQTLASLGHHIVRLSAPAGLSLKNARAAVAQADPAATVDFVHYYGLGVAGGGKPRKAKGASAQPSASADAFRVGMIDTDVAGHPALAGARVVTWAAGRTPGAATAHGTAVASILAQAGQPTIYSANIFRGPAAKPFTSADVLADALEWVTAQGPTVINMSLAGPRNAVIDRLIADMISKGRAIVAAAGNGGPSAPPAYPAALPGVIAVTAVDKDMRIYRYANRDAYVDLAAHGVDVPAANAAGGTGRFSGTSFATPRVAAWMARCTAAGSDAATCRARLEKSARDLGPQGRDDTYGWGFVG